MDTPATTAPSAASLPVVWTPREERAFWKKLARVIARITFAEDLVAAFYCAVDRNTPAYVRATLLGAIAYFVLPIDAIPDVLAGIGFTDDAAVLAAAIGAVGRHIKDEHRAAARRRIERLLG
jgi:uncharacterized membrane protein YkvA (DUF1232 family)